MRITLLTLVFFILGGCVASQPQDISDVCSIFEDRHSWYKAARAAEQRWGVPIPVNMAFIYQESGFQARAKPERTRILWIIPGPRPSSAFGYAQALDSTWAQYEQEAGKRWASRADFDDAIDFVAWYNAFSTRASRNERHDARNLYLAYHEGNAGFKRGTYREKPWLLKAASQVQSNAERFDAQLARCRADLDKNWFLRLFS